MKPIKTLPDFSWTEFGVSDLNRLPDEVIGIVKEHFSEIKSVPREQRTFANTILPLERARAAEWKIRAADILFNVSPDESVRTAAGKAVESFETAMVDIERDREVYRAISEYAQDHSEVLDPSQEKLVSETLRSFRRLGLDLEGEDERRLKSIEKELTSLLTEFTKNINTYEDFVLLEENELGGLSPDFVSRLSRTDDGKIRVTLQYPDIVPFLEQSTCVEKRKLLAEKNLRKGGEKNLVIAEKILSLRDERAKLLGYPSHAAYRLEERMARDPKTVNNFLEKIANSVEKKTKEELSELKVLKQKQTGSPDASLEFFDIAFYANELKKEKYSIDDEELRAYFPLRSIKERFFEMLGELFEIRFERLDTVPVWHPSVEVYAVKNSDGTDRAYFFLDLAPRSGKYGHAAAFNIISGYKEFSGEGNRVLPQAVLVANFPEDSDDHPALLSHDEVETFLHEFGHILHEMLSLATYPSQTGFGVAWDFVEAPSQMLEYFAWEEGSLQKLSSHVKTGSSLPSELISRLIRTKDHMKAYSVSRQVLFAEYDLRLHNDAPRKSEAFRKLYLEMVRDRLSIVFPETTLFLSGFGHFREYDAGYYGYLWARVYTSDLFSRFRKEGVLNQVVGKSYRSSILEPGSSRDEVGMMKDFLGRDPGEEAFLGEISN